MKKQNQVIKHFRISVQGKVQGVFFRLSTKAIADQLGIKGFVQNQADGSVFIEAEGDDFAIDNFMDWCHEGPEKAEVTAVQVTEHSLKYFKNFEVIKSKNQA